MSTEEYDVNKRKKLYEELLPHQKEFMELAELAGIEINPSILCILIHLLNLNVQPEVVYSLLKMIKNAVKSQHSKMKHSDQ